MYFDAKTLFLLLAIAITVIAYIPYIRDILNHKTKPHIYTWLIWLITVSTAAMGAWHGGSSLTSVGIWVFVFYVFIISLLSFKYGTKDITKSDTFFLLLALSAVLLWWQLNNPLLAVLMVTVIDVLAYVPTYRKSFKDPYSETIIFWLAMALVNTLLLLANTEYNLLTVTYVAALIITNIIQVLVCIFRRRAIATK